MPTQWGGSAWGGGQNPYRLPSQTSDRYQPGEYGTTPIGQDQLEDPNNRLAAFTYYNQGYGVSPESLYGKWLGSEFGNVRTGYDAALTEDPELTFGQYYHLIFPQLQQAFAGLTPDARGENIGRYFGLARTVPRGY